MRVLSLLEVTVALEEIRAEIRSIPAPDAISAELIMSVGSIRSLLAQIQTECVAQASRLSVLEEGPPPATRSRGGPPSAKTGGWPKGVPRGPRRTLPSPAPDSDRGPDGPDIPEAA